MRHIAAIAVLSALSPASGTAAASAAGLCARWAAPQLLGQLDISQFPEASGIELATGGARLYHINDGDAPQLLVTRRDGREALRIAVRDFAPIDVEDLALGPCGQQSCIYLADIGDNARRRTYVQVAVIGEQDEFGAGTSPRRIITARYPDGSHNAEAMAIHPSGDLYVVTKAGTGMGSTGPARVYRLRAAQLAAGGVQTFEPRGEIPVHLLIGEGIAARRVVTAMDIAPDGGRFVLLTYDFLLEIAADLSGPLPAATGWTQGGTHRVQAIAPLIQAEAIAYDEDGRSVLYSSESVLGSVAPVMQQRCEE